MQPGKQEGSQSNTANPTNVKVEQQTSRLTISPEKGSELNRLVFQAANVMAAGAFVALISFLGSVWDDQAAAKATLKAAASMMGAMAPYAILSILLAYKGTLSEAKPAWLDNLNRTLPVWALLILFLVGSSLWGWHNTIATIIENK